MRLKCKYTNAKAPHINRQFICLGVASINRVVVYLFMVECIAQMSILDTNWEYILFCIRWMRNLYVNISIVFLSFSSTFYHEFSIIFFRTIIVGGPQIVLSFVFLSFIKLWSNTNRGSDKIFQYLTFILLHSML